MERLKKTLINSAIGFLILSLNILEGIEKPYTLNEWMVFVIPFLLVFPYFFIKLKFKTSFWVDTIVYLLMEILCIVFGDKSNTSSADFFYLFCLTWGKIEIVIGGGILSIIAISIKFLLSNYTITQTIKYLLGYIFIFYNLFDVTWPKQIKILTNKISDIDKKIIHLLLKGKSIAYISENSITWKDLEIDHKLSENAIRKRIQTVRKKFKAGNDLHLINIMSQEGIIKLK